MQTPLDAESAVPPEVLPDDVEAPRVASAGRFQGDGLWRSCAAASLVIHLGFLGLVAFFVPHSWADEDEISPDQQILLQGLLQAAAEKELKEQAALEEGGPPGDQGGGHASPDPVATEERRLIATYRGYGSRPRGIDAHPTPDLDRLAALVEWDRSPSFWDNTRGDDDDAPWSWRAPPPRLDRWRYAPEDPYGLDELALEGVGVPDCARTGGCNEPGAPRGTIDRRPWKHYVPERPGAVHGSVRAGALEVAGQLPPEVVHGVVRQGYRDFRRCYEDGLRRSPTLHGRVAVRFVVGSDGAISHVQNGGSDLPDSRVVSCVHRAFHGLSFPRPAGGIVTVTVPLVLAPAAP